MFVQPKLHKPLQILDWSEQCLNKLYKPDSIYSQKNLTYLF